MSEPKNSENARIFVGDVTGPAAYTCFFEEEKGHGYLYVSDRKADHIVKHLQIYDDSKGLLLPREEDIQILWSRNGTRCGVTIWGKMRGIMDVSNGREILAPLEDRHSPAITDNEWLSIFDNYLNKDEFVRARQRYWKEEVRKRVPDLESRPEEATPIQTKFIVFDKTPSGIFAVLEDDGETGYLYVYTGQTILRNLHVYNRSKGVDVSRTDVRTLWSENGTKCGVMIWGKMRGIVDLKKELPGRVWLESYDTPGIDDKEWLRGFY